MKLERTLTDDIVSRQVTPAITASNNRLCCNTMLAMQLQQPPSSSQPALPMQLSKSLPMMFSSITACTLRSLHASGISLDFVGTWGRFRTQTPLQPSLGTSIVFLFRHGCYSGSISHSRHSGMHAYLDTYRRSHCSSQGGGQGTHKGHREQERAIDQLRS